MGDVKDALTAEDIEALNKLIDKKVSIIRTELNACLDRYQHLSRQTAAEPNGPVDVANELEVFQTLTYLALIMNGLSTLLRKEVQVQAEFLKLEGVQDSTLAGKAGGERVKALQFIERLITELGDDAAKLVGLPALKDIQDAQTGKPIVQPPKNKSDLN